MLQKHIHPQYYMWELMMVICNVPNTDVLSYNKYILIFITVEGIIEAAVVLHTLLRSRVPVIPVIEVDFEDEEHNMVPGNWRDEVQWQEVNAPPEGKKQRHSGCEATARVP